MDALKNYQEALESVYSSLEDFSDIDWNLITQEHFVSFEARPSLEDFIHAFPEFLQNKASEGDAPAYLFELAFLELIQNQMSQLEIEAIQSPGLHLNPTLSFLELEFDLLPMLAQKEKEKVIERPHVLCVFKSLGHEINHVEITDDYLSVLQKIEGQEKIHEGQKETLRELIDRGLVFEL